MNLFFFPNSKAEETARLNKEGFRGKATFDPTPRLRVLVDTDYVWNGRGEPASPDVGVFFQSARARILCSHTTHTLLATSLARTHPRRSTAGCTERPASRSTARTRSGR